MFFSKQIDELKTKNRVLTDAARKRSERIAELERQVADLQKVLAERPDPPLTIDTEPKARLLATEQAKTFEEAAIERAHAINKLNSELAAVREAATNYSFWGQELDRLLIQTWTKEAERHQAWRRFLEPMGVSYRLRQHAQE